ncbi:hypothetical protein Pogu_2282 [Pyrobaculum oguniense TE7]|uniref:Uncharacterized protein n=1 Tax=Pyrobaculum oguniense (strain DSM 13380 / JCM 10595 / TE7) TaxID=698757 RepID=H6QD40_PYROT|nr:hypothetical protein Pogu_2282 [Pyrobaculum oguniense TE7]
MHIRTFIDERGEPIARIVSENGTHVVSVDVFKELEKPPEGAEVLEIAGRYKVYVKRRPFLNGQCEFVYFQFPQGVQLINAKYVGPDDPDVVIPELLKAAEEEA